MFDDGQKFLLLPDPQLIITRVRVETFFRSRLNYFSSQPPQKKIKK